MKPVATLTVTPSLPDELKILEELAYNLRWTWDPETAELFRRLDPNLWEVTYHNPVRLLGEVDQDRLHQLTEDPGFLAHLKRAAESLHTYMQASTWFSRDHGAVPEARIAYFSAEFGLAEALPIYSGGLGVLSGDHLKSASTLGLPLVGVGLLYQRGYFRQYLNSDGWQQEDDQDNDFYAMPVRPVRDASDREVRIYLSYPEGEATVRLWKVQIGRLPLILLDTNLQENAPEIRAVTGQLYGGDEETRMRQEILLGIGGLRALDALDLRPTVCHMNEGHSAFLALERIARAMEEQELDFAAARTLTTGGNVFTTHTPVPAGHDAFPPALVERYFASFAERLGLSMAEFLQLGQVGEDDPDEPFNMTVLALRLSALRNGVSQLHGQVSRHMWNALWPDLPEHEVPIAALTNGVHVPTWISPNMRTLQDNYLGVQRLVEPQDQSVWQNVDLIPPEELWRVHESGRECLVAFTRQRLRRQLRRCSASPVEIARAQEVLNSKALTIGFARRFATYKRATLLFRDLERLARILGDEDRPVQIVFAGKAHPQDHEGKVLIQEIVHAAQREDLHHHIVFVEDYDMCVARHLVQGVDIWLNTPRRPLEASGTSGMKAMANGALNLSVLDGWWAEAYQVDTGWAIGAGEEYEDATYQDEVEANAVYQILEKEAVPLFYERGADGLPRGWIARMKSAMGKLCPAFNTHRMVREYAECFYLPAHRRFRHLESESAAPARALAQWQSRVQQTWDQVHITGVEADHQHEVRVDEEVEVRARLELGSLGVDDVIVQLYHGRVDARGEIVQGETCTMEWVASDGEHTSVFAGCFPSRHSGRHGYTVRVLPCHADLVSPREFGRATWIDK